MKEAIDIPLVLNRLVGSHSTGRLEVSSGKTKWQVLLQFGQLLSADCSIQSLSQVIYRLRQLGCNDAAKALSINTKTSEDLAGESLVRQEIDRLVREEKIDQISASQISKAVTKEAMESLLWLQAGSYEWREKESNTRADLQNTDSRLDLPKLIEYYQQRLTIWQKHITIFNSPHQRPYIIQHQLLEKPVAAGTLSPRALNQVAQLMRGTSLRELSLLLKQDELKVVQLLIPYIRENVICVREPSFPFQQLPQIPEPNLPRLLSGDDFVAADRDDSKQGSTTKTYKIACIDDSLIILNEIERFLRKNSSYLLTKIEDPIKASSLIFRLKPDLILMDITMPGINGYKLCHLLRDSDAFKKTPIIMVTGNKGLIDKVRAQVVGATDYLTKPFTETELLELVGKYLS
jgi:two-component system, chemotaxis family, response regulator PixG